MMLLEKTVRIVNKSKETVTIRFKNGRYMKMSWEDFNKAFSISPDNLHLANVKEVVADLVDKATELTTSYSQGLVSYEVCVSGLMNLLLCSKKDAESFIKETVKKKKSRHNPKKTRCNYSLGEENLEKLEALKKKLLS